MRIYTRTGDYGETSLRRGQRVPKDSLRLEALGTVDELNAAIGFAAALLREWQPPGTARARDAPAPWPTREKSAPGGRARSRQSPAGPASFAHRPGRAAPR
ncbi:MAG: hypothetical protein C4289_14055 [Chloroflexota bacterium]